MIEALSAEQFQRLVSAYGAAPDRWPGERRGGAVACLVESGAARTAWREAAVLDADLDRVARAQPSADVIEQVMAMGGASADGDADRPANILRHFVPYAAAAAIALIVGLAVPSPFRDGADTAPQGQIAATAPFVTEAASDDLTALALVDGDTLSDDSGEINGALNGDSLLSGLPLL